MFSDPATIGTQLEPMQPPPAEPGIPEGAIDELDGADAAADDTSAATSADRNLPGLQ